MTAGLDRATAQIEAADLPPEREAARRQILEFCRTHPDALHRSCLEGHLTGSAAIVDPVRRAALILHHVKLDRWLQPGGHADGDGDLARVALREATEETGLGDLVVHEPAIDIDVHSIPARPGEPEHLHLDVRFLLTVPGGSIAHGNDESHALAWWSPDSDGPEPDASTIRLLQRALGRAVPSGPKTAV